MARVFVMRASLGLHVKNVLMPENSDRDAIKVSVLCYYKHVYKLFIVEQPS